MEGVSSISAPSLAQNLVPSSVAIQQVPTLVPPQKQPLPQQQPLQSNLIGPPTSTAAVPQQQLMSQIQSQQPHQQGFAGAGGVGRRGRKPGSKNKPKTEKAAKESSAAPRREYEFNSEDEHATEPMTYDEKRQLSMDINMLSAYKLTKLFLIFFFF